jgi:hypothetical protein
MTLIILTVVVIASLIAVLAVYLSVIGVLLNRIADNLDDCLGNVKIIMGQAEVVLPGVGRINQTGDVVAGALPLLVEAAEGATTKLVRHKRLLRIVFPGRFLPVWVTSMYDIDIESMRGIYPAGVRTPAGLPT